MFYCDHTKSFNNITHGLKFTGGGRKLFQNVTFWIHISFFSFIQLSKLNRISNCNWGSVWISYANGVQGMCDSLGTSELTPRTYWQVCGSSMYTVTAWGDSDSLHLTESWNEWINRGKLQVMLYPCGYSLTWAWLWPVWVSLSDHTNPLGHKNGKPTCGGKQRNI